MNRKFLCCKRLDWIPRICVVGSTACHRIWIFPILIAGGREHPLMHGGHAKIRLEIGNGVRDHFSSSA